MSKTPQAHAPRTHWSLHVHQTREKCEFLNAWAHEHHKTRVLEGSRMELAVGAQGFLVKAPI